MPLISLSLLKILEAMSLVGVNCLMLSIRHSGSRRPASSPDWRKHDVNLGETLSSQSSSLYPGVEMGIGLSDAVNFAMD